MSDPDGFCPREIVFLLAGNPAVQVTATENGAGGILFKVDVLDTTTSTGDLRALFFDLNPDNAAKMAGLAATGAGPLLTEFRAVRNGVLDLGDGATLAGKVKAPFDVGLEWGTPGGKKDDINFEVSFTLQNAANDLTLDDIAGMRFGAKLDSIGGPGGTRNQQSKLLAIAPAAPNANDDSFTGANAIYEDGAAGLGSPSKDPQAVTLNVLANDTDTDTPAADLRLTGEFHDGPSHGTVAVSADGRSILYTPDLDYSGTDSFWYCMTDGSGGMDSALVTVEIVAVADDPVVTWTVAQGDDITEMVVTVTATQNDDDGSEYIDQILVAVPGGLPGDVQIAPGSSNPANQPDQLVAQFTIDAAAMTDYDFNVLFRATAAEESNGDTETADSDPLRVLINYTHNEATLNHVVTDQSIWNTGDAFVYDLHEFLGVDTSDFLDPSGGFLIEDPIFGTDILEVSYDAYLKAGFQIDVHFEAGDIDANIPVDLTIDTTYNKTTDKIYLTSTVATGSGGSFTTQGPQGSLNLDFIFNYLLGGTFDLIGFDPLVLGPYGQDYTYNIIGIDTEDPDADSFTWDVPPFTVEIAWPQIAVTNAPGTMSGSGESNPILNLTADIDQIANFILGGALSFLDDAPSNTEDDFELADLDLAGALKLLQDFAIAVGTNQSVTVILEDGDTFEMIFGTPLTIDDASSHDVDNDGNVSMSFDFTPEVELTNSTSIGVELSVEVALVRNLDVFGYDFTLYDPDPFPIFETGFEVFNETFALQGVGSANYGFIA